MDKGVILMGEAAQAYVTFKYVELAVASIFIIGAVYGVYRLIKYVVKITS